MPPTNVNLTNASMQQIAQPDSSVPGTSIVYASGVYDPKKNFRSAEVVSTGTAGILVVHLVHDPADQWYNMELTPGVEKGRYFDKVKETGTTVTLSEVTLFPCP